VQILHLFLLATHKRQEGIFVVVRKQFSVAYLVIQIEKPKLARFTPMNGVRHDNFENFAFGHFLHVFVENSSTAGIILY
jgi:hypothetical protein